MEANKLCASFKMLQSKDDYLNYKRNRELASGKSKNVFRDTVIRRVKLEYMGCTDGDNLITYKYDRNTNSFETSASKFDDLIQGNNILQAVSKKYAELSSDKEPVILAGEERKKYKELPFTEKLELDTKTGEYVFTSSWNGSLLVKGVIIDEEFSFYDIKRKDFFEIYNPYNPKLIEAFCVFELVGEDKKNIRVEIYSQGKTEYRLFDINSREETETWEELEYDIELVGMVKEGKGYINTYEGWQVGYIPATSDYNTDIVSNVGEIVVQDTTTSQSFSKALNPVLQVPESMIEYDEKGKGVVRIDDRIVTVGREDKDVKQIEINTKVDQWKIQRDNLLQNIFISTATNENILGLSKEGSDMGSGVAVERSMQGVLSVVNYKRNKVYKALEDVINWGYSQLDKGSLNIKIIGDDILNKSKKEQLEEEGMELDNLLKTANVLVTLERANTDTEIQTMVNELGNNLKTRMKELGLGGIRSGKN